MPHVSRRRVLAALAGGAFWRPAGRQSAAGRETFVAFLTGSNQVPPVETDAVGFAVFRINSESDLLSDRSGTDRSGTDRPAVEYQLFVASVEDATEAHIHKGPPDLNGNVVAYLFGPVDDPVTTTGLLSSGTISDDDLVWPLTDVAELRDEMRAANVYVNVHTTDHPSGEIRGQIRPL